jgi:hypothetical protein
LVGYGHSSGDPSVAPQTIEQAIRLLGRPTPWQRNSDLVLSALETGPRRRTGPRRKPILKTTCLAPAPSFLWIRRAQSGPD